MRKLALLSAASIAFAFAAPAGATKSEAAVSTCGHLEELAAAKRALAEGKTQEALRHLKNADELLSRCQPEQQSRDRDRDLANAPSEALAPAG
jgi:hypothetical protein